MDDANKQCTQGPIFDPFQSHVQLRHDAILVAAGLKSPGKGSSPSDGSKLTRSSSPSWGTHGPEDSSLDLTNHQLTNPSGILFGSKGVGGGVGYGTIDVGSRLPPTLGIIPESQGSQKDQKVSLGPDNDCRHSCQDAPDGHHLAGTCRQPEDEVVGSVVSPAAPETGTSMQINASHGHTSLNKWSLGLFGRISAVQGSREPGTQNSHGQAPTGGQSGVDIEAGPISAASRPEPPRAVPLHFTRQASRHIRDGFRRSFVSGKRAYERAKSLPYNITTKISSDEAYAHVVRSTQSI